MFLNTPIFGLFQFYRINDTFFSSLFTAFYTYNFYYKVRPPRTELYSFTFHDILIHALEKQLKLSSASCIVLFFSQQCYQ